MEMEQEQMPHRLSLSERKKLTVTEVISFEETAVILQTCMGLLTVQGSQLQLKTLSLEGGQVEVEGTITALHYEEPKQSGGWLSRLLG